MDAARAGELVACDGGISAKMKDQAEFGVVGSTRCRISPGRKSKTSRVSFTGGDGVT